MTRLVGVKSELKSRSVWFQSLSHKYSSDTNDEIVYLSLSLPHSCIFLKWLMYHLALATLISHQILSREALWIDVFSLCHLFKKSFDESRKNYGPHTIRSMEKNTNIKFLETDRNNVLSLLKTGSINLAHPILGLLGQVYTTFFQENQFVIIMYKYTTMCLDSYILVYN